jgi:hypothetical protein
MFPFENGREYGRIEVGIGASRQQPEMAVLPAPGARNRDRARRGRRPQVLGRSNGSAAQGAGASAGSEDESSAITGRILGSSGRQ